MEQLKHITVKQRCEICKKKIDTTNFVVPVTDNFSVEEIKTQLQNKVEPKACKKHPDKALKTTFSYYHEEIL